MSKSKPIRLTYRDGFTGKDVERWFATESDAVTMVANYTYAQDSQVYLADGTAIDMKARPERFWDSVGF